MDSLKPNNSSQTAPLGLHVFVIDDDDVTRTIICGWLAKQHFRVTACANAEEAISLLPVSTPDIFISDIRMTGMSGLELTGLLKRQLPLVPIILITGYGDSDAVMQALNLGADHLLTKPVDRQRLLGYLQRLADTIATRSALSAAQEDLREKNATLERIRENDRAVGASVQEMILYRVPPDSFGPIRCSYRLAPALKVSGDFLDYFAHSRECIDVVVGDAMGKGLGAALLSAGVKTAIMRCFIDAFAPGTDGVESIKPQVPSLAKVMASVQRQVQPAFSKLESFVTLLAVRFHLAAGVLQWLDCGHNKMVLLRRDSPYCLLLHGDNLPLGVMSRESYVPREVPLFVGDRLLLMTDGVIDAAMRPGSETGLNSVIAEILANRATDVDSLADRMIQLSEPNELNAATIDDRTVLTVEVARSMGDTRTCQALFAPQLTELQRARSWVRASALTVNPVSGADSSRSGFDTILDAIELGFTELFSNIIRHGFAASTEYTKPIWVMLARYGNRLHLEVQYVGREFPYRQHGVSAPDAEKLAEGGYGLFIIESSFDEVVYYSDPSGQQGIAVAKFLS